VKIKRRTTITTTESDEVLIIRKLGTDHFLMCPICEASQRMLPLTEAAFHLKVPQRMIFQWIEAGLIHFSETADGGLFVCVNRTTIDQSHND
jgi:hypothetical protein